MVEKPTASARERRTNSVDAEPDPKTGLVFWLVFCFAFAVQLPLFAAYLLTGGILDSPLVEAYLWVYAAPFAGLFPTGGGLRGLGMVLVFAPLIGTTMYSAVLALLVCLWWGRRR